MTDPKAPPPVTRLPPGAAHALCSCAALFGLGLSVTAAAQAPSTSKRASAAPSTQALPTPPPKPTSKRHLPGVRGMFEAAQELYDAGKYPEALVAFGTLLRKYPGNEAAAIQLAKTLYRLDRIKEAYGIFSHISPLHLDTETAYEYSWAFYTNKNYQGALYGFQTIPKGHALYDLANYYGALCAIKLKKYEDAADMLDKAVVLPDKLAQSRALYVKHVQALLLMQEKNTLAKDRVKEKQSLDASNKPKKKEPETSAPEPTPKESCPYKHFTLGPKLPQLARVKYTAEHQNFDYSGLRTDAYDAKVSDFDLLSCPTTYLSLFGNKDHQTAFGLHASLGAEDRVTHGKEQRILVDESDADLTRQLNKDLAATDVKQGTFGAEPWVDVPLPQNLWLALGGAVNFTYPDFARINRTGNRSAYLDLFGTSGALKVGGEASYKEILNPKTKPTTTITSGVLDLSGEVAPKLSLKGRFNYDVYGYLNPSLNLDGPDMVAGAEMRAHQDLPFGFSLEARGIYQAQQNYVFHIPSYSAFAADAQAVTGRVIFVAMPVPFLRLEVSDQATKTTYQLRSQQSARDAFDLNEPSYVEDFYVNAALNMWF